MFQTPSRQRGPSTSRPTQVHVDSGAEFTHSRFSTPGPVASAPPVSPGTQVFLQPCLDSSASSHRGPASRPLPLTPAEIAQRRAAWHRRTPTQRARAEALWKRAIVLTRRIDQLENLFYATEEYTRPFREFHDVVEPYTEAVVSAIELVQAGASFHWGPNGDIYIEAPILDAATQTDTAAELVSSTENGVQTEPTTLLLEDARAPNYWNKAARFGLRFVVEVCCHRQAPRRFFLNLGYRALRHIFPAAASGVVGYLAAQYYGGEVPLLQ